MPPTPDDTSRCPRCDKHAASQDDGLCIFCTTRPGRLLRVTITFLLSLIAIAFGLGALVDIVPVLRQPSIDLELRTVVVLLLAVANTVIRMRIWSRHHEEDVRADLARQRCPRCRYPLAHLPTPRCPECGLRV